MERACSAGASPAPSGSCTDASDDSVEVRVRPVALPSTNASSAACSMTSSSGRRNKRKLAEPRRLEAKRSCRTPWDSDSDSESALPASAGGVKNNPGKGDGRDSDLDEDSDVEVVVTKTPGGPHPQDRTRVDHHAQTSSGGGVVVTGAGKGLDRHSNHYAAHCSTDNLSCDLGEGSSNSATLYEGGRDTPGGSRGKQKQRNYKNMTRERRVEANARERTRVHTISAAFDSLRRAVPAYSYNQKLSKLAILKIACSYILALASLTEQDYSLEQDKPSFSECVDLCTRTIQNEGRARRRKE